MWPPKTIVVCVLDNWTPAVVAEARPSHVPVKGNYYTIRGCDFAVGGVSLQESVCDICPENGREYVWDAQAFRRSESSHCESSQVAAMRSRPVKK